MTLLFSNSHPTRGGQQPFFEFTDKRLHPRKLFPGLLNFTMYMTRFATVDPQFAEPSPLAFDASNHWVVRVSIGGTSYFRKANLIELCH